MAISGIAPMARDRCLTDCPLLSSCECHQSEHQYMPISSQCVAVKNSHSFGGRNWALVFCMLILPFALAPSIAAQPAAQTQKPSAVPGKGAPLAEVNGKAITSEEVDELLGVQLSQIEEQLYQ